MKLGLSMWSFVGPWKRGEIEVVDFIRRSRDLGVDGVELLDFFFRQKNDWSVEIDVIRGALDETGLPVGVFSVGNDFAQSDASARSEQVNVIKKGVDAAKTFGSSVVRVFAGGHCEGHQADEVFGWFVDGLSEASKYAEDKGVKLALENHGLIAGKSAQVCDLICAVREKSGNSALGANPDTGNFLLVNESPNEAVKRVAEYAYMCHFKDFAKAEGGHEGHAYAALDGTRFVGTAIGEGDVDLGACVVALNDAGFDGWLNIEYESEETPETGVPRSVQNARRYV